MKKIGQIALEFTFMMMLGFTFLIVVLSIISVLMIHKTDEQSQLLVEKEVLRVQEELLLASSVQDGYSRKITIPSKIGNYDFTIIQSESLLEFKLTNNAVYTAEIPEVNGVLQKGTNLIKKNGIITIS